MKINKLKFNEILFLARNRLSINQKEFSEIFEMSRATYSKLENGIRLSRHRFLAHMMERELWQTGSRLEDYEECIIRRRRSGLNQGDMAACVGKSRNWLIMMEAGHANCEDYLEYLRSG